MLFAESNLTSIFGRKSSKVRPRSFSLKMKQKKNQFALFVVALAALVGVVTLVARAGSGQSQVESQAATTPVMQPLALV